jgi:hypothetical protein
MSLFDKTTPEFSEISPTYTCEEKDLSYSIPNWQTAVYFKIGDNTSNPCFLEDELV